MNYWTNLWNSILGKSYGKEIQKPVDVNRGASWQSAGGVKPTYSQGTALEAYGVHAYTHAAVARISADLAALRLKLYKKDSIDKVEIYNHPVIDLFNNPNSEMTGYLFRAQLLTDLLLAGNCYILMLGSSNNNPVSLLRLHPDEVRIITDIKEGITGYEHNSSGSVVVYPKDRIIHGKNVSYAKGSVQVYGCGATEALSREIDADLNSQKLASDASSKGRPDILLYPKEEGDIWPQETRRQILDNYSKMAVSGGAMVLSGQCEVRELKLSPREMEFEASRRMARESISALLGCPPTVLGLPSANFATSRQQNITYWQNQIKKGKLMSELFSKIAQLFDNSLFFEHDYSNVEALQSTRDSQLARIEKHIQNGIDPKTAYEYENLQYPKIDNQEEIDILDDQENEKWIETLLNEYKQDYFFNKTFENKNVDLEISTEPSNPKQQSLKDIQASILGNPANWERYSNAHVLSNPERSEMKEGYLLLIARRRDPEDPTNAAPKKGNLVIYSDLLARAIDLLNGSEGKLPITEEVREAAYKSLVRYFNNLEKNPDPLLPVYLSFDNQKKNIKTTQWENWIKKQHTPTEKELEKLSKRYLKEAAKRYAKRAKEQFEKGLLDYSKKSILEWSSLYAISEEQKEFKKVFSSYWKLAWNKAGSDATASVLKKAGRKPDSLEYSDTGSSEELLSQASNQVVRTRAKKVGSVVQAGLNQGLSIDEIAENIENNSSFGNGSAKSIARTEATRLINRAAIDAYSQASSLGINIKKEWLTAGDENVRISHQSLNGVSVEINQPFTSIYGDTPGPGEWGIASEDVNCRCTVIPNIV